MVSSHYLTKNSHLLLVLDCLLSHNFLPSHSYDNAYSGKLQCMYLILLPFRTILRWAHPFTDENSTEIKEYLQVQCWLAVTSTYLPIPAPNSVFCCYWLRAQV